MLIALPVVATAYYLSPAVRSYWGKQLGGNILWYATTLEIISDYLEKIESSQTQVAEAGPAAQTA